MRYNHITWPVGPSGYVRTLRQQEELPLLRDHLLRLDAESRHDRFNGIMDDSFIDAYAAKCAGDGTVIIAYIESGVVRGAAELHPADQSPDGLPEIAASLMGLPVEAVTPEVKKIARTSARSSTRVIAGEQGAQRSVVVERRVVRRFGNDKRS